MRQILRTQLIILVPLVMLSLSIISCDDANQVQRSGTTTISGSVAGPFLVSIPTPTKLTFLTRIKKLLSIIIPADAQGDDIEVEASQNGAIVDSSFVADGMYKVEVPAGGPVKLDFVTPDETFSVEINVTPSSEVVLDVDLELSSVGPVADIQRFDITSPRIATSEDESFSFNEPDANLTIEGGGEDCVRSTGIRLAPDKINVDISVDELNLNGCRHCVFADGNQSVVLRTELNFKLTVFGDSGDISCVASDDAIRADESSKVKFQNQNQQGGIAILSSGANGIAASGIDTVVDIEPGARGCSINAEGEAIVEEDGAVINADCGTGLGPESQLPGPPLGGAGGGCGGINPDKGGEVISRQKFGFGKYVFDVTPVSPDSQGMINGFFLLDAKCGAQDCPPFFVDWPDNQREVDIEFVPGWSHDADRPRISNGSDCSADNTNCNVQLITDPVAPPQNFVSFNTFANNSAGQTQASNHQAFYEMSSSPFGARNKYTIYYTPCGIQWSVASERGDAPILYQNSAHINDNQNENTLDGLRNFIHTVDFDQIKAAPDLHIYINYYVPTDHNGFSGGEIPPDKTKSFVYSVEYFPLQGGGTCSTPSNPISGAACSIDGSNKITCNYSDVANFKSDFENGVFELNGNSVQSWEDLWIRALFDCWPIFTCPSHTRYNGKGNPLELCFIRMNGSCNASPGCDF